jgi:hypothetical protein
VHLRVADSVAYLALGEILHEAELEHPAFDLGQRPPSVGDGVTSLHQLVGGVLVPQQLHEHGRLAVVASDRRVE